MNSMFAQNRERERWAAGLKQLGWSGRWVLYALTLALVTVLAPQPADAGATRTQTLQLRAGWNAVFLSVQPSPSTPAEVFRDLPVDTVACFIPGRLDARYLRQPGDAPWREEGWAVWHAPARPEAFLSNLHEIQAHRGLLILARSDCTWTITGEARAEPLQWHPNTCTFTGLPVDGENPPTFATFFAGSTAHAPLRVYRLESGVWKLVRDPAADNVREGEAYWIETEGASTYQGPLQVRLPRGGGLEFAPDTGGLSLTLENTASDSTARVKAQLVGGTGSLRLLILQKESGQLSPVAAPFPAELDFPLLAPGAQSSIRLQPDWSVSAREQSAELLKITDGRGALFWVPIRAHHLPFRALSAQP